MKPIYIISFITIAYLACFIADGQTAPAVSGDTIGGAISASYDVSRVVNESYILLNAIVERNGPSKREELFLIGEVAISSLEEKLENLSLQNGSQDTDIDLIESRDLAILYSDMSYSLGVEKIPVVLVSLGPQKRIMPISNLSEERAVLNRTIIDENLFLPLQPASFIREISEGKRESSMGVDVIWS